MSPPPPPSFSLLLTAAMRFSGECSEQPSSPTSILLPLVAQSSLVRACRRSTRFALARACLWSSCS